MCMMVSGLFGFAKVRLVDLNSASISKKDLKPDANIPIKIKFGEHNCQMLDEDEPAASDPAGLLAAGENGSKPPPAFKPVEKLPAADPEVGPMAMVATLRAAANASISRFSQRTCE